MGCGCGKKKLPRAPRTPRGKRFAAEAQKPEAEQQQDPAKK